MKTFLTLIFCLLLVGAFAQSNVGIGLQAPTGKLHILTNSGTSTPQLRLTEDQLDFARIKFENTVETGASWDIAGLSRTQLEDSRLNFFYSGPNGSGDRMTILGNGNVGIGLTNPKVRLDVDDIIRVGGNNWPASGKGLEFAYDAGTHRGSIQVFDRDLAQWGKLYLGDGNVGIGLTAPTGKLHIQTNSGTSTPHLRLTENQLDFARLKFENTAETDAFWDIAGLSRTQPEDSKLNFFYSGPNGSGDRMTILGNGNVGIGNSNPSERLHVNGGFQVSGLAGVGDRNVIVDSQGKFKIGAVGNSDTDWIETATAVYNNSKNIGIGTLSPQYPLSVTGQANSAAMSLFTPDGVFVGGGLLEMNGYGIDAYEVGFLNTFDADLLLQTNSTGNVGIGTDVNLASKLTIEGPDNNGTIAALEIRSEGNGQTMLIDGNEIDIKTGNLHINASSGRPVTIGTFDVANGYQLSVGGRIIAEEVRVQLEGSWPDYVFAEDYELMPLEDLEQAISENGHLPGIPAAEILEKEGLDTGEMQRKVMEKIEELTLHVIALNKKIIELETASK